MARFGFATNIDGTATDDLSRTVAGFARINVRAVKFNQHRIVNLASEGPFNGLQISLEAIGRELHSVG